MHSTRIKWFVVCLGLACLMLRGGVLAGNTTATEVTYAQEIGASNAVYSLPTGNPVERLMNVLSGTGADSLLDNCLVWGFFSRPFQKTPNPAGLRVPDQHLICR